MTPTHFSNLEGNKKINTLNNINNQTLNTQTIPNYNAFSGFDNFTATSIDPKFKNSGVQMYESFDRLQDWKNMMKKTKVLIENDPNS